MKLKAREYNQPITLININISQDDFGKGKADTREEVLQTFAKVIQISNNRARIENSNAQEYAMQFLVRYTDVTFNAVAYKGQEYIVSSVTNLDMANRELLIEAQRAE